MQLSNAYRHNHFRIQIPHVAKRIRDLFIFHEIVVIWYGDIKINVCDNRLCQCRNVRYISRTFRFINTFQIRYIIAIHNLLETLNKQQDIQIYLLYYIIKYKTKIQKNQFNERIWITVTNQLTYCNNRDWLILSMILEACFKKIWNIHSGSIVLNYLNSKTVYLQNFGCRSLSSSSDIVTIFLFVLLVVIILGGAVKLDLKDLFVFTRSSSSREMMRLSRGCNVQLWGGHDTVEIKHHYETENIVKIDDK